MTINEVFGKFKEWETIVEKRTGKRVNTLSTDNEVELCNSPVDNFCKAEGIVSNHIV